MQNNTERTTTNYVHVLGFIENLPKYSHRTRSEEFYSFDISVPRFSGTYDFISCIIPKINIPEELEEGQEVELIGSYRSHNKNKDGRNRLFLDLFVDEMKVGQDILSPDDHVNHIELDGHVCRKPKFRITPRGREITEFMICAQRRTGRQDYIPCICWGRLAKRAESFELSDHISLTGRIQSRDYIKKFEDGSTETRKVYEVSCRNIRIVDNEISPEE